MVFQAPGTRRINVHARTINNWRNGRSRPRSLEDPRLLLVLKALAPSQEEMSALARSFEDAEGGGARRRKWPAWGWMRPGRRTLSLAVFAFLALSCLVVFSGLGRSGRTMWMRSRPTSCAFRRKGSSFLIPTTGSSVRPNWTSCQAGSSMSRGTRFLPVTGGRLWKRRRGACNGISIGGRSRTTIKPAGT